MFRSRSNCAPDVIFGIPDRLCQKVERANGQGQLPLYLTRRRDAYGGSDPSRSLLDVPRERGRGSELVTLS
jgi:hypothetical protein